MKQKIFEIYKNKYFINAFRFLVSFYFIYFVFSQVDISSKEFLNQPIYSLLIALILVFFSLIIAILRWRIICLSIGIDLSLLLATKICFLGAFFNQILPTSFGGDVVRFNELRSHATPKIVGLSIAIDRGLTFLVILIHVFNIFIYNQFNISNTWMVIFFIGELLFSYALIFILVKYLVKIEISVGLFLLSVTLSYISLLFLIAAFWSLLEFKNYNHYLILYHFPVSMILSALPVSIGGWGLREGYLLSMSPSVQFASLIVLASVLFGIINIFTAIPGMIIYLFKIKK